MIGRYFCNVIDKPIDQDVLCLYQKNEVPDPSKKCFACDHFKVLSACTGAVSPIPEPKNLQLGRRRKRKRQSIDRGPKSWEDTRRKCMLVSAGNVAKRIIKYAHDPVAMWRDPELHELVLPFSRYAKGEIILERAKVAFASEMEDFLNFQTDMMHLLWVSISYEEKTGGDFTSDRLQIQGTDDPHKVTEASLNIVKAFPESYWNEDIQRLIKNATMEKDNEFLRRMMDARVKKESTRKRRDRRKLFFLRANEEKLKTLSSNEQLELARKQGFDFVDDALRIYLNRAGLKKRIGRPCKPAQETSFKNEEELLRKKKRDWQEYLFAGESLSSFRKKIKDLEGLISLSSK